MSELRNAASDPRSPSTVTLSTVTAPSLPVASGVTRPRRSRGAARTLLRAGLSLLPGLLLGVGCMSEDTTDPALEGDTSVGQGSTNNASTGGATSQGAGGSAPGGSSSVAGSSQQSTGAGGNMSVLDAAPGETGIFVGMTAAHNAARQSLELDPPLPDLTWSEELADFAQEWADTLVNTENCGTIFHRTQNMYGENIAFKGSAPLRVEYAPEEAVESWFSEIDCWEYGTIRGTESCEPQCIGDLNSTGCGHFTQIAWRNSREVGCGYATCQDGRFTNEVWVCNYDPPGNYIGQTPY
jgi:pathogenesis-related protein 1